jgi:hypothetical protein
LGQKVSIVLRFVQNLLLLILSPEKFGDMRRGTMVDLYSRSYFTRSWTLQELALSGRAKVICGESSISWKSFATCGKNYLSAKLIKGRAFLDATEPFHSHLLTQKDIRLAKVRPKGGIAASELLQRARNHDAGNPKDKIYGFIEILRRFDMKLPTPDYNKSISTIYEETVVAIIEECSWLYLLDFVNSPKRLTEEGIPDLPSWILDWSDSSKAIKVNPKYNVCRGSRGDKSLLGVKRQPGQLPLRGKRISKILKCCDAAPIPEEVVDSKWENWLTTVKSLRAWLQLLRTSKDCEKGQSKAISGLLMCSQTYSAVAHDLFVVWSNTLKLVEDWWEETGGDEKTNVDSSKSMSEKPHDKSGQEEVSLISEILNSTDGQNGTADANGAEDPSKNYKLTVEDQFLLVLRDYDARHEVNGMSLWEYQDLVRHVHPGDSCFLTEEGFMGTAYHTIRKGDDIVLFAGANHPMIIRANGNNLYQLIGPAYIPSIMQGEAWPEEEVDLSKLEIFTLI